MKNFSDFLHESTESNWEGGKLLQKFEDVIRELDKLTLTKEFDFQAIDREFFFEFATPNGETYRMYFDRNNHDVVLLDEGSGEEVIFDTPEKFRNYLISTT